MTVADWVAAAVLLAVTAAIIVVGVARPRPKGVEPLSAWDMQHSPLLDERSNPISDQDGTP